jgi:hypothetical protein
LFSRLRIETALAIPVFSGKATTPSFIFSCYSFVRSGTVPFVLKFVQQALRLLWAGLDKIQPHASVGNRIWKDLEPADLGEMAADVEMQQHFMFKKRPHHDISPGEETESDTGPSLTIDFESMEPPSGIPSVRSIYTGAGSSPDFGPTEASPSQGSINPSVQQAPSATQNYQYQSVLSIQGHIQNAIRSIGDMKPAHQHVATNKQGSKRAHVYIPPIASAQQLQQPQHDQTINQQQEHVQTTIYAPLPMPRPLPAPTQVLLKSQNSPSIHTDAYQYQSLNPPQHNPTPVNHTMAQSQSFQAHASLPQTYAPYQSPKVTRTPVGSETISALASSVPKDQISAIGISFSVPPKTNMNSMNGMQTANPGSTGQNPALMNSFQFCLPTKKNIPPQVKISPNGKVRPNLRYA